MEVLVENLLDLHRLLDVFASLYHVDVGRGSGFLHLFFRWSFDDRLRLSIVDVCSELCLETWVTKSAWHSGVVLCLVYDKICSLHFSYITVLN